MLPPASSSVGAGFCPAVAVRHFTVLLGLWLSLAVAGRAWGASSGTGFYPYASGSAFVVTTTANIPLEQILNPLHDDLTSNQQTQWKNGYLNVCEPPYNAHATSGSDNSLSFQQALHDGYYYNFSVYVPSGTYELKEPLTGIFPEPNLIDSNVKFCHVLVGSSTGGRSVLKFTGTGPVNPLVIFQYESGTTGTSGFEGSRQYGSTFRSLDIDMQSHPASDALSMVGAQNCAIEDVHIYGTNFNAGISGIPASGGSINNVTVTGGKFGIVSADYQPAPLLCGITLTGQSAAGVEILESRGPVSLVGFNISNTDAPAGYAAILERSATTSGTDMTSGTDPRGDLDLVDGEITVTGSHGGIGALNTASMSNVAMRNVYINAPTLIQNGTGTFTLTSTTGAFQHIQKYVFVTGSSHAAVYDENTGLVTSQTTSANFQEYDPLVQEDPPADLVTNHIGDPLLPPLASLSGPNVFSITATYSGTFSATPDDPRDDDAIAINDAIAAAAAYASISKTITYVTIPRGHYHIKSPITLLDGVNLIGGGKNSSVLHVVPSSTWESGTTGRITNALTVASGGTTPLGASLQDFGLLSLLACTSTSSTTAPSYMKYVTLLRIQNSDVTMHDVVTTRYATSDTFDTVGSAPVIEMNSAAGGRFYNLCVVKFEAKHSSSGTAYHLLNIANTTNPIYIYAPSIEHQTVGGAQIELDNAQNVHFLALKAEGLNRLMQVNNSYNCSVFGAASDFSSNASVGALLQMDSASDKIWTSLLERRVTDIRMSYPWIVSGSDLLISGSIPVGLFKQGDSVVLGDGFTETFSNTSSFPGRWSSTNAQYYSTGTDETGHSCLNFTGTGSPEIFSTQTRVSTTKGYEVSVQVRMPAPPEYPIDTPALVFMSNPSFIGDNPDDFSARIRSNGNFTIVGPGISEIQVPCGALLNGGSTSSTAYWNRLTVRVSGSTATVLINGKLATSFSALGIANGLDADIQNEFGATTFGLSGHDSQAASFENFQYYPAR